MKYRLLSTLCLPAVLCAPVLLSGTARADEAEVTYQTAPPNSVWLDTMNLGLATAKIGRPYPKLSAYMRPLTIGAVEYPHGVGTPGESEMTIVLHGNATQFQSHIGLDDTANKTSSVSFTILVDDKIAFDSGEIKAESPARYVQVDLKGAKTLVLRVTNLGTSDFGNNANWAGALIRVKPNARLMPAMLALEWKASFPVLFAPGAQPVINGPEILGLTPGRPFLYRVPAAGTGALTYAASNLPSGLKLDAKTGIISGQVKDAGTYPIALTVSSPTGKSTRTLTLKAQPKSLALTPPMGWSAYDLYGDTNSDEKVRAAAQWLVKSGLASSGYRVIWVGDAWQDRRDGAGNLTPNKRFRDMKALGDYLHSLGLLFGLHSAATERTATGGPGSQGNEERDAKQFAAWGVDYLTYEWSPRADDAKPMPLLEERDKVVPAMEKAFTAMRKALDKVDRDIVFSITVPSSEALNFGSKIDVATLAKTVGAEVWEERNNLYDSWKFLNFNINSKVNPPSLFPVNRTSTGSALSPSLMATPKETSTDSAQATRDIVTARAAATADRAATIAKLQEGLKAAASGTTTTKATAGVVTPGVATAGVATPAMRTTARVITSNPDGTVSIGTAPTGTTSQGVAPVIPPQPQYITPPGSGPSFWSYPGAVMAGRFGYPDLHFSRLTPNELMYQMTAWALISAPLVLKSDLQRLNPNLLSSTNTALLTNPEVLAINQDPKGSGPKYVNASYPSMVRSKELADGTLAIGIFNSAEQPRVTTISWDSLKLTGAQPVRDLWNRQDLGTFTDSFKIVVAPHSVAFVKVGQPGATNKSESEVAN